MTEPSATASNNLNFFEEANREILKKLKESLGGDGKSIPLNQGLHHRTGNRPASIQEARSKRVRSGPPPPPQRIEPFSIDSLPLELQQRPLFVFCKFVAGELEVELDKLFNMTMLSKEKDEITLQSLSPGMLSATAAADFFMNRVFKEAEMTPISWTDDIITNLQHPLYMPFVFLVAAHRRKSIGIRPRGSDSTKQQERLAKKNIVVQREFTRAVVKFKTNGYC